MWVTMTTCLKKDSQMLQELRSSADATFGNVRAFTTLTTTQNTIGAAPPLLRLVAFLSFSCCNASSARKKRPSLSLFAPSTLSSFHAVFASSLMSLCFLFLFIPRGAPYFQRQFRCCSSSYSPLAGVGREVQRETPLLPCNRYVSPMLLFTLYYCCPRSLHVTLCPLPFHLPPR